MKRAFALLALAGLWCVIAVCAPLSRPIDEDGCDADPR
ncbi:hypothetical protein C7967_101647 [Thalassospira sp. 11-3]|jgi:hypothetical protein|nr:hypothetical protein C7967_101647 [Thalassospira sp. 11-3]